MPTVTLDEREWQGLIQLVVNAMIQGNPVLLKLIAQVQQPQPQRGNSHDGDIDAERGTAGRGAKASPLPAAPE